MSKKSKSKWEYGDFQTPVSLATRVCEFLLTDDIQPKTLIEPTCGTGSFIKAAFEHFPSLERVLAAEINKDYHQKSVSYLESKSIDSELINDDFFSIDWKTLISQVRTPVLIIGNPPWVTSADLGSLDSSNLPLKTNRFRLNGLDAKTGKSNFDISEFIILESIEWLQKTQGTIAFLCKTKVARNILSKLWKSTNTLLNSEIIKVNAVEHFNASVDACLFKISNLQVTEKNKPTCSIYSDFSKQTKLNELGINGNSIISDVSSYEKYASYLSQDPKYIWRSGIKHDCSSVMELTKIDNYYVNGFNEKVQLEHDYVYPLLKGSDIGNGRTTDARKYLLVTQKQLGANTKQLATSAPLVWNYLSKYSNLLDARKSSIYKAKPRYSIFGVGDYSFSPFKVAICGLYKNLEFRVVIPIDDKPVVFDDTVCFLSCSKQEEAQCISDILNSEEVRSALESVIFWEDKRPITIDILNKINITLFSELLNKSHELKQFADTELRSCSTNQQNWQTDLNL
jgi:hypothetical protein